MVIWPASAWLDAHGILCSHEKGVLPFAVIQIDPEDGLLSEISQTQTNTVWSHWRVKSTKTRLRETENRSLCRDHFAIHVSNHLCIPDTGIMLCQEIFVLKKSFLFFSKPDVSSVMKGVFKEKNSLCPTLETPIFSTPSWEIMWDREKGLTWEAALTRRYSQSKI